MLKTKNNTGRISLLFLAVLFAVSVSSALQACQCETVNTELLFTNEQASVQHYTLQKSGIAGQWTTIAPTSFSLQPSESELVVVFTRIDCNTDPGVYSLSVKAVSSSDVISKSVDFSVSSCHSVSIASDESIDSCVNAELVIPLTIDNQGNYVEDVNLSSSIGNLSISSLTLDSNDSQVVNLILTPSSIGVNPVVVDAFFGEKSSSTSISVNAAECSFFNASLSHDLVNLCEGEEEVVNVMLTNHGDAKYFHFNSSSSFIDLPADLLVDGSLTVPVTVFSTCDKEVINSEISVSADGARTVDLPLVLNLRACYLPIIVAEKSSDSVCACESLNYSFTLFNPGNRSITYALSPSAGNVSQTEVTLGPDETADLILSRTIPCSFTGDLPITLTATSISTCSKSSIGVVNLNISPWDECEAVSVDGPLVVPVNDSQFTVPVSVRNIGIRPASYNVIVSGSAMSNLLGSSKSFVTLDPGQSDVVELVFDPVDITGSYVNVQVFSTDNLASDTTTISFGGFALSQLDFYFLLLPSGVVVLLMIYIFRSKFFKKSKAK